MIIKNLLNISSYFIVKKYNNILVIGLGMMGASLCKSIRRYRITEKISGYDLNNKTLLHARKKNIVDNAIEGFNNMLHPDLIILCTPLSSYTDIAKQLIKNVHKNSLLTDIGSSKGNLHKKLYQLTYKSKIDYLSSHPMVGSEKFGIENNKDDIYRDKIIFIIDKNKAKPSTHKKIVLFWKALGSVTYDVSHSKHDQLMSQTSHISHLMSYIFMQSLPQKVIDENLSLLLGGGIKEHVRLSRSNAKMWSDIFINNSKNITKTISKIQKNLKSFTSLINNTDESKIESLLEKIQKKTK